jgi:oligogalacturonide transport system permease protein
MVYPLIWMVGATFKTNSEIFTSAWFWPKNPVTDGYANAFVDYGGKINLIKSLLNTYKIVVPKVIFTVISATITAYGFGRFEFKGKAILFSLMISTLFLPQVVLNAPQYIMFNNWGWTNSYLPLVIPSLFAGDTYFLFMLVQFLRGVPKELEEAAKIDGCNSLKTLWYVIVPMLKPSLVSVALFQFMWTSNDFMGPLIYVSDMPKYTNSIYLRMSMDGDVGFQWNRILAMSLISIIPSLIVFFCAQDSFIDGIAAGGVKG